MSKIALAAAFALAATTLVAEKADAATIVTGGDVTLTLTYDLTQHNLWGTAAPGAHAAVLNGEGQPELKFDIQASRFSRGQDRREAPRGGSQVVDGGLNLHLNGGVYLFPTLGAVQHDADGNVTNEIAKFDDDTARLCCRHVLSGSGSGPAGFGLDTTALRIWGNIDGVSGPNRNPPNPDSTLFTLVETGAGSYDVIVTEWTASFLNYAYHPAVFGEHFDRAAWLAAGGSDFTFQGGEKIGELNINAVTADFVAAVPVPAALPLLIGGLGLMGVVGNRRRKAA